MINGPRVLDARSKSWSLQPYTHVPAFDCFLVAPPWQAQARPDLANPFGCKIFLYIGIMEKKMETTIVYWGYISDNGK